MPTQAVTCQHCGRVFTVAPSRIVYGFGKFCSHQCHNEARRAESAVARRFWAKVDRSAGPDGCWLWTAGTGHFGYGKFRLSPPPDSQTVAAHRVSWMLTYGAVPEGLQVLHSCDNPPCVNPAHLFLGTTQDNVTDMVQKGRKAVRRGEERSDARLTDAAVRQIRQLWQTGDWSEGALGRRFGVSAAAVHLVLTGRTWKHVV